MENPIKSFFVIRGLPNSGKTVLANQLAPNANCAANQFFEDSNIEFSSSLLEESHRYCHQRIRAMLESGLPMVAVHNTFTTLEEIYPYTRMAANFGYAIYVIEAKTHFPNPVHDIPKEIVKRYAERWEPFVQPIIGGFKFN